MIWKKTSAINTSSQYINSFCRFIRYILLKAVKNYFQLLLKNEFIRNALCHMRLNFVISLLYSWNTVVLSSHISNEIETVLYLIIFSTCHLNFKSFPFRQPPWPSQCLHCRPFRWRDTLPFANPGQEGYQSDSFCEWSSVSG